MYSMQPLLDKSILPKTCDAMYSMSPLMNMQLKSSAANVSISADLAAALATHQETLLQQIQALQSRVATVALKCGVDLSPVVSSTAALFGRLQLADASARPQVTSLAVHVRPSQPPLALCSQLQMIRTAGFPLHITSHMHSSVSSKEQEERHVQVALRLGRLLEQDNCEVGAEENQLHVALVWSNLVPEVYTRLDPCRRVPLIGEAMALRLLEMFVKPSPCGKGSEWAGAEVLDAADDLLNSVYFSSGGGNMTSLASRLEQRVAAHPPAFGSAAHLLTWSATRHLGRLWLQQQCQWPNLAALQRECDSQQEFSRVDACTFH